MKELAKSETVVFNPKIESLEVIYEQISNLLEKKSRLLIHELTEANELILDTIKKSNNSEYNKKHLPEKEAGGL